jgi:subfamily B ATP-binding cassette protein MsbA
VSLPAASRIVVDEVVGHRRLDLLLPIAILVSLAISLEAVCSFAAAQAAGIAGQSATAQLRCELGSRALRLPMRTLDDVPSATLATRIMTDTDQVRHLVGTGSVQLAASLITAIIALGMLVRLEPALTFALVAVLGTCAAAGTHGVRRITGGLDEAFQHQAVLTGRLAQQLMNIRIIKAYAAERREASGFARGVHRQLRQNVGILRQLAVLATGGTLASESLGILLLVGGAWSVTTGRMTIGGSVMYAWLAGWLVTPVLHLCAEAGELGKAWAALRRIAELRGQSTEDEEDRHQRRVRRIEGGVEFVRVSFAYRPNRPVLRDISLHCPPGSMTALVGPNGSGKSTVCRLLSAYDRPTSGRVLVDGHDLATLHRRSYRSMLGVVLQDEALVEGTIADNIRYGRPGAPLAEVEACGRLAQCDDFVARLPDGYSTLVGERGAHLSAGQRQLVAIARAFLIDPRVLVLDEATSNLDAESERRILSALRALCRGRTTLIIAHRASTIRIADQVIVLDRGAVREHGLRHELSPAPATGPGVPR